MSDDEDEMAALRRSHQYQQQRPVPLPSTRRDDAGDGSDEDTDTEMLRAMLPSGFGKSAAASTLPPLESAPAAFDADCARVSADAGEADLPRVKPEPSVATTAPSRAHASDNDDILAALARSHSMPVTSRATIAVTSKPVTALSLDHGGARLVCGAYDSQLRIYDFSMMTSALTSTHTAVTVVDNHPIIDTDSTDTDSGSSSGLTVVASNSAVVKVYDSDCQCVLETVSGDRYLLDQSRTTGHTAAVTAAHWTHDTSRPSVFFTSGRDGVVRVWDMNASEPTKNIDVLKLRGAPPRGLTVTAFDVSNDGSTLAAAATDGSLRVWARTNTNTPQLKFSESASNLSAHSRAAWVSSVRFDPNNDRRLFTRTSDGADPCVKLWDVRQPCQSLATVGGLPTAHEQSGMAVSPDSDLLLVPCDTGDLAIIDLGRSSMAMIGFARVSTKALIRARWHRALNQIFISSADGNIYAFYDEHESHEGLLLAVKRRAKRRAETVDDDGSGGAHWKRAAVDDATPSAAMPPRHRSR